MQTGTVKVFMEYEGYGFITAKDGSEIFVYGKDIHPRHIVLLSGQSVTYEEGEHLGRPCAKNVRLVEPSECEQPSSAAELAQSRFT